jgi:hypothetical protein
MQIGGECFTVVRPRANERTRAPSRTLMMNERLASLAGSSLSSVIALYFVCVEPTRHSADARLKFLSVRTRKERSSCGAVVQLSRSCCEQRERVVRNN